MTTSDPKNVEYRSDLAHLYAKFGSVYADSASKAGASVGDRIERWRQAKSWYQKSLGVWSDMRQRGILKGADADQPDQLAKEMAKCEAALMRLER